jgi:putative spermidine/putrescine transport system permease protein
VGEVRRFPWSAWIWIVLGMAYFFIPLVATFLFSVKNPKTGNCCSLSNYGKIIHDPAFWASFKVSLIIAALTIALSLVLFVPTVYWVHLKLPKLRPVLAFMALVPFVVPPIILVVGLLKFYKDTLGAPFWYLDNPYWFLTTAYVILAFPYVYFSVDAGFRSIDVHTLTEASLNLGAGWRTTLTQVILPNIRVAALSGALLTLAVVMGEFTIASLSAFHTFPTYIQYINETEGYPAAALTLLSFAITWGAMATILLLGRKRGPGRAAAEVAH